MSQWTPSEVELNAVFGHMAPKRANHSRVIDSGVSEAGSTDSYGERRLTINRVPLLKRLGRANVVKDEIPAGRGIRDDLNDQLDGYARDRDRSFSSHHDRDRDYARSSRERARSEARHSRSPAPARGGYRKRKGEQGCFFNIFFFYDCKELALLPGFEKRLYARARSLSLLTHSHSLSLTHTHSLCDSTLTPILPFLFAKIHITISPFSLIL